MTEIDWDSLRDKNGEPFDAEKHQVDNGTGKPRVSKNNTLMLKPARKKGSSLLDNPFKNRPINRPEEHRAKIETSKIMNRLTNHALGKNKMTPTQVQAGIAMLKKTLPDLQSQEIKQEITEKKVVSAEPMSLDDWETQASVPDASASANREDKPKEVGDIQDQPNVAEIGLYKH